MSADDKKAPSAEFVPNESHYHSKKDRTFVRAIAGPYNLGDELKRLRAMPRVRKGKDIKFNDGPQAFSRHYVEPKDGITQTFHMHLEEYGPGGNSQKHGHVNEAAPGLPEFDHLLLLRRQGERRGVLCFRGGQDNAVASDDVDGNRSGVGRLGRGQRN